ncbi:unnamed protein product [Rotaria sp. Silwood2]|nr:unnamed protein product [Rotaria sp. Silwood2]CAF4540950.1 unnamed protein product [Rotaria sp. Silwood2]
MLRAVYRNSQAIQVIPLKNVNIHSTIRSFAADVRVTQIFRNDETTPIEAVYCFPIEEQAAIYAFKRKQHKKDYTEALEQGHGAYLMEQDEKSQDNFIINVGALPPSKECTITVSYMTELDLIQGSIIRFVVPTTIAPRYNPERSGIASPTGTNAQYVQKSPYTIAFCCQVENLGGRQIAHINSSSHPIEIDLAQGDRYTVKFAQQNTHLDHDILINIELTEKRDNLIATIGPGAIMATFMPTEDECQRVTKFSSETNEFIFVVDCSGSMRDENKIGLARQAILLFLKSLPMNCYFNIIRFGSSYEAFFNEVSVLYNEDNARKAEALVNTMQADLGGTELLEPLKWLEQHSPIQGRSRQVFRLTDGEISNVTEVLDLCLKGVARSTNGRFVFIPPNTTVDVHVEEQLQKALQRCITNVKVKWNLSTSVVETVPNRLPPVYAKDRLIVYGLFDDKLYPFDHNSSVELHVDQHQLSIARIRQIPSISENGTIARLATKALILKLQYAKLPAKTTTVGSLQSRFQGNVEESNDSKISELKEIEKKRLIELSVKYKILSPHTAFIGIEKRINEDNTKMLLREIPIQISADDQHLQPRTHIRSKAAMYCGNHPMSCATYGSNSGYRGGRGLGLDDIDKWCANQMRRAYALESFSNISFERECPSSSSSRRRRSRSRSRSRSQQNRAVRLLSRFDREREAEFEPSSSEWPLNDQDIVRHLIDKQHFSGLWDLDTKSIRHLTGRSLADFQLIYNDVPVLISAIVLIILETRFGAFLSMWHGISQKTRTVIIEKLGKDPKNLEALLESIRKQL